MQPPFPTSLRTYDRRDGCRISSFCGAVLAALVAGLPIHAQGAPDARTFRDVPRVTVSEPDRFRTVFDRARTALTRVAIFGDSQETAPNGWGGHYVAHLNAGFCRIYGPAGETTLFGNTSHYPPLPQWLATMRESEARTSSTTPSAAIPPGVFLGSLLRGGTGEFDVFRNVFLHDASRTIDPALADGTWFDPVGPYIAEVAVRARIGSPGLLWSNAPTDLDTPHPNAAIVASGTWSLAPKTQPDSIVWFATPPLSFAGKRHLQLGIRGESPDVGTDFVGLRYRSLSAHKGLLVQSFSKGGMRISDLTTNHGDSGAVLRAWGAHVAVIQYGANDAGNGISIAWWRSRVEETIAWIRAAMQDPAFPVILVAELHISQSQPALAIFDHIPVVAHDIALADPNVLALNMLRIANEDFHWGPSPTGTWRPYLADAAHYRPHAQRLLAQAFVGEIAQTLAIDDPSCTLPHWRDCARALGASCQSTNCRVVTDADAAVLGLDWQGAGSTCIDGDKDGAADQCAEPRPGDLDGDGAVGPGDLAILLAAWGSGFEPADLDRDGVIGAPDLALLLADWTHASGR